MSTTETKVRHTPGPWTAFHHAGKNMQSYSQSSGVAGTGEHAQKLICGCFNDIGGDAVAEANAEFIVRAVNSHADMLEALEAFIRATSSFHKLQLCKQPRCELCGALTGAANVIAKAKGGA